MKRREREREARGAARAAEHGRGRGERVVVDEESTERLEKEAADRGGRGRAGAVSGARSSASLGEKERTRGVDIARKRGLTRDACPGEAITRRAAGAGHERGLVLPRASYTVPRSPVPLPPHPSLPPRTQVPLRRRRAASTTQPASQRLEPRSPYPLLHLYRPLFLPHESPPPCNEKKKGEKM